jgi:hypothetical protein
LNTGFAANASFYFHPPNISILWVSEERPLGTGFYTRGICALSALGHREVIREFFKRILKNLNPRQGKALYSFMDQGTGKHTGQAALTFFGIDKEIPFRGWNGCNGIIQPNHSWQEITKPCSNGYGSSTSQEIPPRYSPVTLLGLPFLLILHRSIRTSLLAPEDTHPMLLFRPVLTSNTLG